MFVLLTYAPITGFGDVHPSGIRCLVADDRGVSHVFTPACMDASAPVVTAASRIGTGPLVNW